MILVIAVRIRPQDCPEWTARAAPNFDKLLFRRVLAPSVQHGHDLSVGHLEARNINGTPLAVFRNPRPLAVVAWPARVMGRDLQLNHRPAPLERRFDGFVDPFAQRNRRSAIHCRWAAQRHTRNRRDLNRVLNPAGLDLSRNPANRLALNGNIAAHRVLAQLTLFEQHLLLQRLGP